MNRTLACALGVLTMALGTAPCRADHCSGPGCASIHAASCCNPCCNIKPTLYQRIRAWCQEQKHRCEANDCDDCCKPTLLDRLRCKFKKEDCCESKCDDCCKPTLKERFQAFCRKFKKCNDDCCTIVDSHAAPAAKAPEKIGAPMPKPEEKPPQE